MFLSPRFIPESTRWLISNNRIDEAKKCIQIAAKENRVKISDSDLDRLLQPDPKLPIKDHPKATILDIFKHPNLRKRSMIVFFNWCVIFKDISFQLTERVICFQVL